MDPYEGHYRYCPQCRCEYRPGFDLCTDCGVDLVDELPPEPADPPAGGRDPDLEALQSWVGTDPVAVLTTVSEINAHVARGLLLDAAIPCSVWGSGQPSYFAHVVALAPFPFRLMVHKDDETEARELLETHFGDELEGLSE